MQSDLERAHSVVGAGLNSLISIAFASGGAVMAGLLGMGYALAMKYGTKCPTCGKDLNNGSL